MLTVKLKFVCCLIFYSMLLLPLPGNCQWTQVGKSLYGGNVTSMTAINEKIFAGTSSGVFLSDDNGATWKATNELVSGDLRMMTAIGNTLYASMQSGKNYKSTDNGTTWIPILPNYFIRKYGIIGNTVFAMTINGVLLSMDNGSADATSTPTGQSSINGFAIINTTLYMGGLNGLYSSSDRGLNWTPVTTGLTGNVLQIESTGSIIAVRYLNSPVVLSTDGGATWSSTGITSGILSIGKMNDILLIGNSQGVSKSTDNGVSWSLYNDLPNGQGGLAMNSSGYYYGTAGGVYRSLDAGTIWTESSSGIEAKLLSKIITIDNNLIIASGAQLFKNNLKGELGWVALNPGNPPKEIFYSLGISGKNILAGTYVSGVFVSPDNGVTWTLATGIDGAMSFAQLGDNIYASNFYGIYVSHDSGLHWELFSPLLTANALRVNGSYLFATTGDGKVLRFTNDGQSVSIQTGLPSDQFNAFAFAGNEIYCSSTNNGIYVSANNGDSWTKVNTEFAGDLSSLVVKDKYFYMPRKNGIYYSIDKGTTWVPFTTGLPSRVVSGTVGPMCTIDNKLYAASNSSNVWVSCIVQEKPTVTPDFTNPQAPVLTSSSSTGNIWYLNGNAITNGTSKTLTATEAGVYTVDVTTADGCTSPKSENQSVAVVGDLSKPKREGVITVYPIPATSYMMIDLSRLESQPARIEIIDAVGRKISEWMCDGGRINEVEISSYKRGLYFIKAIQATRTYRARVVMD